MEHLPVHRPAHESTGNSISSHLSSTQVRQCSNIKRAAADADRAETLMPQDPNARPKNFNSNFEEIVFVFTVMMCAASTTFLQGVTVISTATIGRDLHMTTAEMTWISAALGYVDHGLYLHTTNE